MRRRAIVLVAGLLAAGAAAGWALRAGAPQGEDAAALEAELADARARRAAAEADLARRRQESTERAPTTAIAPVDEPPVPQPPAVEPEATWEERVAEYPLFEFADATPEVRDALVGVDWRTVAANAAEIVPVAGRLAAALAAGDPPPSADVGRAQELNGPLLTVAMRLHAGGVPGAGVNGAFTHPAFFTNVLAATLDAAGLPLDAGQAAHVEEIGAEFVRQDRERQAAEPDDQVALRSLIAEIELKADYITALLDVLDAEQRARLTPTAGRGRVSLDMFSEGLVWVGRAYPILHRDDAHLAELVSTRLLPDVEEGARTTVDRIVMEWVAALPPSISAREPDALDHMGMIDAAHVTECARHFVRLIETLLRETELGDEHVERLRTLEATAVPFRTAAE